MKSSIIACALAGALLSATALAAVDSRAVNYALGFGENAALNVEEIADGGDAARFQSAGDHQVKAGASFVYWIMATSGTSPTATFYDDADGTCSSGQKTGAIPLTAGVPARIPMRMGSGICMKLGGTSPDVLVGYR